MKRFATAAVAASLVAAAGTAWAQSSTYTFTSVDAVRYVADNVGYGHLYVTGVLDGAGPTAVEKRIRNAQSGFDMAECRRLALVAMSKPGQYRLSFRAYEDGTYLSTYDCTLTRATP